MIVSIFSLWTSILHFTPVAPLHCSSDSSSRTTSSIVVPPCSAARTTIQACRLAPLIGRPPAAAASAIPSHPNARLHPAVAHFEATGTHSADRPASTSRLGEPHPPAPSLPPSSTLFLPSFAPFFVCARSADAFLVLPCLQYQTEPSLRVVHACFFLTTQTHLSTAASYPRTLLPLHVVTPSTAASSGFWRLSRFDRLIFLHFLPRTFLVFEV